MIPKEVRDKKGRIIKGSTWKTEIVCIICGKNGVRTGRKYCSMECMGIARKGKSTWMKGRKHKSESIQKMKLVNLGRKAWNKGIPNFSIRGEKHHWWRGGITKLNWEIRGSLEYKIWQRKILEKDDFTCQMCGKRGGGILHADHIKSFGEILKKYHIKTFEQALSCKELWDINNGRTLCQSCHRTTDSYPKNLRYATVRSYRKQTIRVEQKCLNPT